MLIILILIMENIEIFLFIFFIYVTFSIWNFSIGNKSNNETHSFV